MHRNVVLIAHNSSKFDSFILIDNLDQQFCKPHNTGRKTIFPNNALKRLSFEITISKKIEYTVIDFANFVPQSLKRICEDFKLETA